MKRNLEELNAEIQWAQAEVDKLKSANQKVPRILEDMLWLLEHSRDELVNQSTRSMPPV